MGHCHSVMHEFAITCEQRLYKFSSFLGVGGGGGWGELRQGDNLSSPPLYET